MLGLSFESTLKESRETDMKKLLLTAIVGALACGNATAETWGYLGNTDNEVAFVNVSDIKKTGNRSAAWVAVVNVDPKKPYDLNLSRYKVDCDDESMQVQASYKYLRGKQVDSIDTASKWFTPPPNSLGGFSIRAICNPKSNDYTIETDDIMNEVQMLQKIIRSQQK